MNEFLQTKKTKCKCGNSGIVSTEFKGTWICRECNPRVVITKYINGVVLNPKEYVLNDDGDPMRFATKRDAKQFLCEHGYKESDIGNGIYIEYFTD